MVAADQTLSVEIIAAGIKKFISDMKSSEKAVGDTEKAAKKSQSGWKKFGNTMSSVGNGLQQLAITAIAFGMVAKKAFEFAEQGAQIDVATDSFERMRIELGQDEDYLNRLRDASNNTISDLNLMAGATTLVAGTTKEFGSELFNAYPQLVEYAKAASKLNPQLGDTSFMLESISTGIKRGSPLILDNLGLVVKVGDANAQYAKQLGKTVTELTAEDKQMALLNATMKAGDRLIEQVGGTVDAATDKFQQLRVEVENVTNELKLTASEMAGPVVTATNKLVDGTGELFAAERKLKDARDAGLITQAQYEELTIKSMWTSYTYADALKYVEKYTLLTTDATENADAALLNLVDRYKKYPPVVDSADIALLGYIDTLKDAEEETDDLTGATLSLEEQLKLAGKAFMTSLQSGDSFEQMLLDASIAAGAGAEELALLAYATGEYTVEQINAALAAAAMKIKIEELAQGIADGTVTVGDALLEVRALRDALNSIPESVDSTVTITTIYKTKYKGYAGGPGPGEDQGDYDEPTWYQAGTTEVPENMNAFLHGGEMVIPANQARVLRQMIRGDTNNNYNLTTQSITQPGGLRLEFDAMEASHR